MTSVHCELSMMSQRKNTLSEVFTAFEDPSEAVKTPRGLSRSSFFVTSLTVHCAVYLFISGTTVVELGELNRYVLPTVNWVNEVALFCSYVFNHVEARHCRKPLGRI